MKVLIVLGTRPEAIKLAPVIKHLEHTRGITSRVCITGQHREMLEPFIKLFDIRPDYELKVMQSNQSLFDLTSRVLAGLEGVLKSELPDLVLVQGDTTTAFVASLAAFYLRIPVGHVEAGLRTNDKYRPFPEEINRRLITHLADLHFAPTERARANLLAEGIPEERVCVTGNTVIDALLMILELTKAQNPLTSLPLDLTKRIILVTAHRRESFGKGLAGICKAIRTIVQNVQDVQVVYPVHLNPNVRACVMKELSEHERVVLVDPLDYVSFVHLMNGSYLILTDSGGIQEEAPSLGKPVLVMRDVTERPEAIEAGVAKLVGTDADRIATEAVRLIRDEEAYNKMAKAQNPFGDGHAAPRIVEILCKVLNNGNR